MASDPSGGNSSGDPPGGVEDVTDPASDQEVIEKLIWSDLVSRLRMMRIWDVDEPEQVMNRVLRKWLKDQPDEEELDALPSTGD